MGRAAYELLGADDFLVGQGVCAGDEKDRLDYGVQAVHKLNIYLRRCSRIGAIPVPMAIGIRGFSVSIERLNAYVALMCEVQSPPRCLKWLRKPLQTAPRTSY